MEELYVNTILDTDIPKDESAERAVLGSILYDISNIILVAESLKEEDFFNQDHRLLYRILMEYYDTTKTDIVDAVLLKDIIFKKNLENKFTEEYLETLVFEAITDMEILQSIIAIVKKKSIQRNLIELGFKIVREAKQAKDANTLIDDIQKEFLDISSSNLNTTFFELKDVLKSVVDIIEKFYKKKEMVTGVPTGFPNIDKLTTGFHEGDLIIVAARPGMGKSSFMLSLMHNMALKDIPVGIFSLEMSKEQLIMRLLSSALKLDMQRLRTGMISDHEIKLILEAKEKLSNLKMYIDDSPILTVSDLRIKARKLLKERNIKAIAIDYLQLVRSVRSKGNRQEEVAEVSRNLKALAKELKAPVIALAQLSRQTEHRSDKRPQLSDLRESGQIEQDADLIIFLHRPEYYKKNPLPEEKGLVEVIIAKQRQGPTGILKLAFLSDYACFYPYSEAIEAKINSEEDDTSSDYGDIIDSDFEVDF